MPMKPRRDTLGDRMKRHEEITRFFLPRRTYTLLRVDGRAFHTWTHGLAKPYDVEFMECMDKAAIALCEQISGTQFAYVQSDEISLLAVDFSDIETESWFDGNIQKWSSVGASVATMTFNMAVADRIKTVWNFPGNRRQPNAVFDARVYTIPDPIEVENYFVWRQQDAERNSVMMLARAYASHRQLAGKKRADQHEIIHKAGDNWAKHPVRFKHGAVVRRRLDIPEFPANVSVAMRRAETERAQERAKTSNWHVDGETPVFTKNREYLRGLVPIIWNDDLLVRKAVASG
jgi:tRNA(His) guanylyltransferase